MEDDWHRRFLAAGVPLVILAEPNPLDWAGILTSPFLGMQGGLMSLELCVDISQIRCSSRQLFASQRRSHSRLQPRLFALSIRPAGR